MLLEITKWECWEVASYEMPTLLSCKLQDTNIPKLQVGR